MDRLDDLFNRLYEIVNRQEGNFLIDIDTVQLGVDGSDVGYDA